MSKVGEFLYSQQSYFGHFLFLISYFSVPLFISVIPYFLFLIPLFTSVIPYSLFLCSSVFFLFP